MPWPRRKIAGKTSSERETRLADTVNGGIKGALPDSDFLLIRRCHSKPERPKIVKVLIIDLPTLLSKIMRLLTVRNLAFTSLQRALMLFNLL